MFPFDYFTKRKAAKAKIEREAELLILVMKDKALGFATDKGVSRRRRSSHESQTVC
jgi:hypothetical protein